MDEWRKKLAEAHTTEDLGQISEFLMDRDLYVRYAAVTNPHTDSILLDRALNDGDVLIRIAAATHKNTRPHHIERALADSSFSVRVAVGLRHLN